MKTVIGIDLGGTKILIGEVTIDGKILSQKKYDSNVVSQRKATQRIKECLLDFFETVILQGEIQGIGIGLVGRVDRKKGIWIEIHPELAESIELSKELSEQFCYPVYLGNDVYCATLCEKKYGIGKVSDNFIYLNVGTGIAARCVVDGKIIEGKNFDAGEIGHMVVDMNSDIECVCGNKGCVEILASGLGLHNRIMELIDKYPKTCLQKPSHDKRIGALKIFEGYDHGDELCQFVLNRALKGVAIAIMNLIRMSDPDAIVLGGGIGSSHWFIEHLLPLMNKKTIRFVTNGIQATSQQENTVGLKGAALLVVEEMKG